MPLLRVLRYAGWTAVAVMTFLVAAVAIGWWRQDGPGVRSPFADAGTEIRGVPQIGGPFSLIDHRGRAVTEATFLGRPTLVFFGFTFCPEICPTTLFETTNRLRKLGPEADRLQVLFVTVDPERDTPEQLALYLQSFDPRILGLSGSREQIDAAVKAFRVETRKVPTENGYNVDHTASVFLMDEAGRFRGLIDYHEQEASALAKMKRLLSSADGRGGNGS